MGNDEIKEILDKLYLNFEKADLTAPEYSDLRHYITTLEQAVKDTKDSADDMLYELKQELEEEKRIEEADLKTIQRLEEENEELKKKLDRRYYKNEYERIKQENEELKEDLANYVNVVLHDRKVIDEYKSCIDEAIEYINFYTERLLNSDIAITPLETEHLLNILQNGGENNE